MAGRAHGGFPRRRSRSSRKSFSRNSHSHIYKANEKGIYATTLENDSRCASQVPSPRSLQYTPIPRLLWRRQNQESHFSRSQHFRKYLCLNNSRVKTSVMANLRIIKTFSSRHGPSAHQRKLTRGGVKYKAGLYDALERHCSDCVESGR
jgi:hypothetical protein